MTKLEWLNTVFEIEKRIECLENRITAIDSLLTGGGNMISDSPRSPSPDPHRNESLIATMDDLKEQLKLEKEKLCVFRERLKTIFSTLKPKQEMIMSMRFIDGMKWSEIAMSLNEDIRNVYRIRQTAENFLENE